MVKAFNVLLDLTLSRRHNAVRSAIFARSLTNLVTVKACEDDVNNNARTKRRGCWQLMGLAAAGAITIGIGVLQAEEKNPVPEASKRKENIPDYTRKEVSQHDDVSKRVWVTYMKGVYDITDMIPHHPGSQDILMAAGSSIEPFWAIYGVHHQTKVYEWLEKYRIGNVSQDEEDDTSQSAAADPFAHEQSRHPALKLVNRKPFNAETPLELIADSFYTPNDLFYVRNHLPTPQIESYELEVSGVGIDEVTFTLDELKTQFPKDTVVCAIQCGGNRRHEMMFKKDLRGLPWTGGAIGNARWSGVRLYDVLKRVGLSEQGKARHIQFEGYDVGPEGRPYGASIPFAKGFNPFGDVLLAYEMNGEPLSADHGFPVRVVVPGVVGARHVKWLNRIVVSEHESDSHWQQNDYKGFNPGVTWDTLDYSKSPAIQNMPVTSMICKPSNGSKVKVDKDGTIDVKGYAYSGSGNRIIRIDLTSDGGKTWFEGRIHKQDCSPEPYHYGWSLWSATVHVPNDAKEMEIWCKAVDSSYNVQPESVENIWNLRGLLSNAYSRLRVEVEH